MIKNNPKDRLCWLVYYSASGLLRIRVRFIKPEIGDFAFVERTDNGKRLIVARQQLFLTKGSADDAIYFAQNLIKEYKNAQVTSS